MVHLSAGTYLTGTLVLKSNVMLHLAEGATLLGSTDRDDYPQLRPTFKPYADGHYRLSLIYGENLHNAGITGSGVIDGQGDAETFKVTPPKFGTPRRPFILTFVQCRHLTIRGVTLRDSPAWVQHYVACENLRLEDVTVYSHANYNNDMIDIDGCRNVRISGCTSDTGDDGLTLKNTVGQPCENVAVTNCTFASHANAIKCGTESRVGFRNISITNCAIRPCQADAFHLGDRRGLGGIALEIVDGGTMDRVVISNITIEQTVSPIFIRLGKRYGHCVGSLRNVILSRITATGASDMGCAIAGLPGHPIENVTLSDIHISFAGGGTPVDVHRDVPEHPDRYPECTMFGKLPAYGFYVRHLTGLKLINVELECEQPDARPTLYCDDVSDLNVDSLHGSTQGKAVIVLKDVGRALVRRCFLPETAEALVRVSGQTRGVSVMQCDLTGGRAFICQKPRNEENAQFQAANRFKR
jgi:polygalacturonase